MKTMIVILAAFFLLAAAIPQSMASTEERTRKYALVIGNSDYSGIPVLKNPKNDAIAIAATLRKLDFNVYDGIDLPRDEMNALLQTFSAEANRDADVVLFYFAGHGFQFNGKNFLVPTDATLGEGVVPESQTLRLDHIISTLQKPSHTTLVFLDACRDNPLTATASQDGTRSTGRGLARIQNDGLAQVDVAKGTFIAFATNPGNVALDGEGDHSPFTGALLKHIARPGLSISDIMIDVRNEVALATSNRQLPWDQSSLKSQFYFKKAPSPQSLESDYWSAVRESGDLRLIRVYLERYPQGRFSEEANTLVSKMSLPGDGPTTGTGNANEDPFAGKALVRGIQTELARLGCRPGKVDGDWGPRSKRALKRFARLPKVNIDGSSEPSVDLYSALSGYSGKEIVCPVERPVRITNGVKKRTKERRKAAVAPTAPKVQKRRSGSSLPPDLSIGIGIGM